MSRGLALAVIVAGFAVLRIAAVGGIGPVTFGDTHSYFSFDPLGNGERLWTVPLLFKSMPSHQLRVAAQVAIAIVSWGALALEVGRALRHSVLAAVGAVLVLAVALTVEATQYDLALLSESLTLSLLALGTAAGLWLARRGASRWTLAALLTVVVLWAFARYPSAVAVALLFPAGAGLALWRLPRKTAWITVGALFLISVWCLYAVSRQDHIWRINAYHLIVGRILPDRDARDHFVDRGLEVTPALRRASREHLGPNNPAFDDPAFQDWLTDEWRPAYASYLLKHWPSTLWDPLRETPRWASEDPHDTPARHVLPRSVETLLWNPGHDTWALLTLAGASILLWILSLLRGPPRPVELVPWGLVLLGVVQSEIIWNYSAQELGRLFVPSGATLRLGFVLLALFAVDRVLSARGPA